MIRIHFTRGVRPYITFPPRSSNTSLPSPLLGVGNALERSLGILNDLLNSADVLVGLLLGGLESRVVLLAGVVEEDAGGLGGADAEEQEVDGGEEEVARLDDEAPASPDQAGGRQGGVLGEREVLCGTGEVGGAGEDETPLLGEWVLVIDPLTCLLRSSSRVPVRIVLL
jgi:hypothetical protein